MHLGNRALDEPQEVAIEKAVEVSRQPALDTDFRGAAVPGFAGPAPHFVERKRIGIGSAGAAAKSAKTATHEAYIREIDVAIDDVGDRIADGFSPQLVRDGQQGFQSYAFRSGQLEPLFEGQLRSAHRFLQAVARFRWACLKGGR